MWRLDKKHAGGDILTERTDDADPELQTEGGLALHPSASPHAVSTGDPGVPAGNIAEPEWQRWREELQSLGGRSPLLHFSDAPRTRIELSTTHPGGLPQFITGHSVLLSNLIRDDLALRNARVAASAITAKGVELRTVRGIEAVHLAIGLAHWRHEGEEFTAPVLLRPLAIRRYGRDFELKLKGQPFLNPELARALSEQFQITLDANAFVALALSNGEFKPQPVIDRLRGLTSHLQWFNVEPRLVVSSFASVSADLLADARDLDHPILDAVAGNPTARQVVASAGLNATVTGQDERSPSLDTLLLDADTEQEQAIAHIAAGSSLVVKTLPGTGGTQTIVNAIGALVSQHKRVLVVSPRKSSLDGIRHRLAQAQLTGMAVSVKTLRRDLIHSIARNEKATEPAISEVDDALVRLRKVLLDYRGALQRTDRVLGVSVLQALDQLTRLAQLPVAPTTRARLDRQSIQALARGREEIAALLVKAAALGEFRYGPDDSPWYGASFSTTEEATETHELAKRLNEIQLPRLLARAYDVIGQTRMRPFESIAELGIYLRLLMDIRETLDRFRPAVFDRPLTELIAATSSKRESPQMSGANRRRLRKLSREYLRPGVHVTDMNASLRKIQQQRTLWQRYVAAGTTPQLPTGIADVQVAYQRVSGDLAQLDTPLGTLGTASELAGLPIGELVNKIAGLSAESEVLANLQERTAILSRLHALNLEPLLEDLAHRHVAEENVADELENAWWQSVLESMLADERALLNANTKVVDRLEADFRLVDEAHAKANGPLLAWKLSETWKIAMVDFPQETERIRALLKSGATTPASLEGQAPNLARILAPVWLASPYETHTIPTGANFDAVFLVDAGATTFAENIGAIRRARQVVAFGDPVTQTPSAFNIGVVEGQDGQQEADVDEIHADSALSRLGALLPSLTLTRSYRAGGEDLAELVNRRFYGGRIESLPWAGTYLGHDSLKLHHVADGRGMPDPETGTVESVDAEVARVVELVLDHATNRPKESLMVITASARHAVRVNQAVLAAFSRRTELSEFILSDRAEAFTVATLQESVGQSRDRVIFSIGYGRTPHGRLLSDFGALAEPGGERLLAVGMTCARRSMAIVSCFTPEDIDVSRMRHGIAALARVLAETAALDTADQPESEAEPLLVDLVARLSRMGITAKLGHRGKLSLVATHAGRAVVVETDTVVGARSLRESLRLRPVVLRRLGWHYLRVHNFELFADPQAVASRIAALIGVRDISTATGPIPVQPDGQ